MADPVGTVRKIYDYFHYQFSPEFEACMLRWLKKNPQGKHSRHDYSLYQAAFTDQMMEEHFGNYKRRFGV